MEIGVSSACFYPMQTEQTLELLAAGGFRHIEIFLNAECEAEEYFCKEMRQRADALGLQVISVHPYCGAYEYINLFSYYPRRREDGLEDYRRIARAGEILGAKYITFHGDRLNSPAPADAERYCSVLSAIIGIVQQHGLLLAQENVSWCTSSKLDFLRQVDERLRPQGLHYTLDVKQALRAGNVWQDYERIMRGRIVNVHISDNDRVDTCLLPGAGEMDFAQFFRTMQQHGYQGDYLIEVYRRNFEDPLQLGSAKCYLENILQSCEPHTQPCLQICTETT